jgi:uncharacterized protein involved in exopolysaccharide biosynthesis
MEDQELLSFWEIVERIISSRRLIFVLIFVFGIIGAVYVFVPGNVYTVETSFRPEGTSDSGGQISSIVSQFGFSLGSDDGSRSPEYYADLLRTRTLLESVSSGMYSNAVTDSIDLAGVLNIQESDDDIRRERVLRWLNRKALRVGTNPETGVITLWVKSSSARLSYELAHNLINEIEYFNSSSRRSQAMAERVFLEEQVEKSIQLLSEVENKQLEFLKANRLFRESPELLFENDRLTRIVSMRQQLHTSLYQAMQQAYLTEVRNTPVITIIQAPYIPVEPDQRRYLFYLTVSLLTGLIMGVVVALLKHNPGSFKGKEQLAYDEVMKYWRTILRQQPK